MLMTRASEYALLSLVVLAKSSGPIDSDTLSRELNISKSFLSKILQALTRHQILQSFKGVNGGFELIRDSKKITILEVMCAVEGKGPAVFDCSPSTDSCPSDQARSCSLWPFLNKLQGKIDNFLDTVTISDLLEE
jgi:Rrf2 family transcriptional regulator, iron-sulfur cluster assembly transcription factor